MRWDIRFGIHLFIAAAFFAVCVMVAPDYLHPTETIREVMFWVGLTGTILFVMAAFRTALQGERFISGKGHRRRVIALYGMVTCIVGFLGFAAAYLWPGEPLQVVKTSEVPSTNEVLRIKTRNFTDSLRRYEENVRKNDMEFQQTAWMQSTSRSINEAERLVRIQDSQRTELLRYENKSSEFRKNYRPDALALQEELITTLRKNGIIEPFPDHVRDYDHAKHMLELDTYAGARPVGKLADYLDFLARKLPNG